MQEVNNPLALGSLMAIGITFVGGPIAAVILLILVTKIPRTRKVLGLKPGTKKMARFKKTSGFTQELNWVSGDLSQEEQAALRIPTFLRRNQKMLPYYKCDNDAFFTAEEAEEPEEVSSYQPEPGMAREEEEFVPSCAPEVVPY